MADPQEPRLPDTAPLELREFVACKRATVTIRNGKLDWLPLPPDLSAFPAPDLSIEPGATPGTATISVGFGVFSIPIPTSLVNGQLHVDTSGLGDLGASAAQPIQDWLRGLNDWLRANGQRFGAAKVAAGEVTLIKEPIPPAAPPPPPPPPATTPVTPGGVGATPPPAPPTEETTGCLKWILFIGVLVLIAGLGYILLTQFDLFGGPRPTTGPATSPPASVEPTSALSTAVPATEAPPTAVPVTEVPSTALPATEAPPSAAPETEIPPTVAPPSTEEPSAADPQVALDHVAALSNGTVDISAAVQGLVNDASGDTYLPHNGSPATADQPFIDYIAAAAAIYDLTPAQVTALSAHVCGQEGVARELEFLTACNQPGPMPAGEYVVVLLYTNAALPSPFPQAAQCSYIVQSDIDGDETTGFQSELPFNHLIGADQYFESLMFWSQEGEFQNYILGTDYGLPPRTDTSEVHGNVPTSGRWFASNHSVDGQTVLIQSAWIERSAFDIETWSVGGFCNEDRTSTVPDTFSVDALGDPGFDPFPGYEPL